MIIYTKDIVIDSDKVLYIAIKKVYEADPDFWERSIVLTTINGEQFIFPGETSRLEYLLPEQAERFLKIYRKGLISGRKDLDIELIITNMNTALRYATEDV